MAKPHFKHECFQCRFLATIATPDLDHIGRSVWHDLYYCDQGIKLPTIVARWGNNGPDYLSGMDAAETGLFPLNIGLVLAKRAGLVAK